MCAKSTFTLTFAIEIIGLDIWHDCNEGWIDLGPVWQALKLQYSLYRGHVCEINVLIWPHVAKILCQTQFCWVRTFQFLDRRWLTFSICHAVAVRVADFRDFEVVIVPTMVNVESLAHLFKNDIELYIPKLNFGEKRYFGPVLSSDTSDDTMNVYFYVRNLIWQSIVEFIPASFMDVMFDEPQHVTDVRHQDAILDKVQCAILNKEVPKDIKESPTEMKLHISSKGSKVHNETYNKKAPSPLSPQFKIKLSGDAILAGAGRIINFENYGDRPDNLGQLIVIISSCNLPSYDDLPIVFVNIGNLSDVPLEEFHKLRISHLYTRWILGNEIHDSQPHNIILDSEKNVKIGNINFNDRHALPLELERASEITAEFLDGPYQIQLRGIREPSDSNMKPTFFGYHPSDYKHYTTISCNQTEETDFLIAYTKINATQISKGESCLIREEFPLYPPEMPAQTYKRRVCCTNDCNLVRCVDQLKLAVPEHTILTAQMSLEVSMGIVGRQAKKMATCYSRMYAFIDSPEALLSLIQIVLKLNRKTALAKGQDLLTGFAIDTGRTMVFYIEGLRDGNILKVWETTADLQPRVKPYFSSSASYFTRIYPELLDSGTPFLILKMHIAINVLLACPSVYVRPTLPVPARLALLKFGRLIARGLTHAPARCLLPTLSEISSFRLELCVPPRPPPANITHEQGHQIINLLTGNILPQCYDNREEYQITN